MSTRSVRVTVPASSANLGPGFDCLGLALGLHHTVTVSEFQGVSGECEFALSGEGADSIPRDERNSMYAAIKSHFAEIGYAPGKLRIVSDNQIPLARGLGSSAAATLAALAAAMSLGSNCLDRGRLLADAATAEGHADNVCASLYGGFCVSTRGANGEIDFVRLSVPEGLQAALAVPDFELETAPSREALPHRVPFADAVVNQGRVALLTAAMASGRVEVLATAMRDLLHQPYRAHLVPGMIEVCEAAMKAGALGAALSGVGPAIVAIVRNGDEEPGRAMTEAWATLRITSRVLFTRF